jgi:hypothetical protein
MCSLRRHPSAALKGLSAGRKMETRKPVLKEKSLPHTPTVHTGDISIFS